MKKLKGYIKRKRNITSLMYVPHSSSKVKIMNHLPKLGTLYAIIAVVLLLMTGYISYILNENKNLQAHAENLETLIASQKDLLYEKVSMLETFEQQEVLSESQIQKYSNDLTEVVDAYINNNTRKLTVSRSGNDSTPSFIKDIAELRSILDYLNQSNVSEDTLLKNLETTKGQLQDFLKTLPTFRPVTGRVCSDFGRRLHPIYKVYKLHTGVDMIASTGVPIKAAASGKVILSGWNGGYGYCIIIDHGNNLATLYAHCSKLLVSKGKYVEQGALIAKAGDTGTATGAHLHFEIRIDNTPVDPMKYLER